MENIYPLLQSDGGIRNEIQKLSKFWKRTIITLSALTVIFALIFGSLVGFLTNMHTETRCYATHSKSLTANS